MSIWDVKLRNLGEHVVKNFSLRKTGSFIRNAAERYRLRYIDRPKAGIRPFFHVVAVCMVINYMIEYKHLKAHEAMRKYH